MKHVVMSILMFAITSCAVEPAPVSTSITAEDESSQSNLDLNVDPHAVVCDLPGTCESVALCRASGEHIIGACNIGPGQSVCCHLAGS